MKYNIGDVVKVRNDLENGTTYGTMMYYSDWGRKGETGRVFKVDSDDNTYLVEFDTTAVSGANSLWLSEEMLESTMPFNFRLGDTVIIKDNVIETSDTVAVTDTMREDIGKIATITHICYEDSTCMLDIKDGSNGFWWELDWIEPIETITKLVFAKGDTVRIKSDLEVGKTYGGIELIPHMADLRGHVGVVDEISVITNDYKILGYYWSAEMLEKVNKDEIEDNNTIKHVEMIRNPIRAKVAVKFYNEITENHDTIKGVVLRDTFDDLARWIFEDTNGNLYVINYDAIDYVLPYEGVNES